jgi:tRNA(fMet)-specific endonuclease VapC
MIGCNKLLKRARTSEKLIRAFELLEEILDGYCALTIFKFDIACSLRFDELRQSRIRIGTMDLRIAATALVNDLILVTRNTRDYSQVPGLKIEDWTA